MSLQAKYLIQLSLNLSIVISTVCSSISLASDAPDAIKVGNGDGGDAVYCKVDHSRESKVLVEGYYALDFLGTLGLDFGEPATIDSWSDSAQRIQKILDRASPDLASSFREYVRDVKNTTDYTRRFTWEKAPYGLQPVDDQHVVSLVPDSCQTNNSVHLVPAAVHQNDQISGRPPGKQIYLFVPTILDSLEQTSPLQLSFLYVHEWLWNHSDNVGRNRRINRFLHSSSTENLSADEIREQLTGMGLSLDRQTPSTQPSTPAPQPTPRPTTPPEPNPGDNLTAVEPAAFQDQLFANDHYCENSSGPMAVGPVWNFRIYSQFNPVGDDGLSYGKIYQPLTFVGNANSAATINFKLLPSYVSNGDLVTLILDGGESEIRCKGSKRMGTPIRMECDLMIGEFTASWPHSTTWVKFTGLLYPGCFVAKASTQPQTKDHYSFMVTGSY